jgi:hypothetical protein
MVAFAVPLIESAVAALGGWLVRAAAILAGAAAAQMAGKSDDDTQDRARARAQELALADRPCKDCPPRAGLKQRTNHSMPRTARRYQGRVTGWPYDVDQGWSDEWIWRRKDFDGFVSQPCLIQEAKADYDQFLSSDWFTGFEGMERQIVRHGEMAKANPPTRVRYYFQGKGTLDAMRETLLDSGVEFEHYP